MRDKSILTEAQVKAIVTEIVPKVYHPETSLSKAGYVRAYTIASRQDILTIGSKVFEHGANPQGLTINLYALMKGVGIEEEKLEKWKDRFSIFISKELSVDEAKFVILHEVGHVDDIIKESELGKLGIPLEMEGEEYADLFAMHVLSEKYGIEEANRLFSCANKVNKNLN